MKSPLIHIIPTLENGGAETVLSRLVNEFDQRGIQQYVITLQGNEEDFNYEQVAKFSRIICNATQPQQATQLFKQFPNAIVLAWMYKAIFYAHLWKAKHGGNQRIIWNIRRSSFSKKERFQKVALLFFGLYSKWKKPEIIYCAFKARDAHRGFGFYRKKEAIIQNGLAKKLVYEDEKAVSQHLPYFLYVGRHNPAKGPDRLIRLATVFFQQNSEGQLKIAGSGWKKEMLPTSFQNRIQLLGNVSHLVTLYSQTTALLFTSYSEGYPNVLVEAASCGAPIIGFEAGDSKLILEAYPLGKSITSEHDFLSQMQHFFTNPISQKERLKAAENARKTFSFEQTANLYVKLISDFKE